MHMFILIVENSSSLFLSVIYDLCIEWHTFSEEAPDLIRGKQTVEASTTSLSETQPESRAEYQWIF